MEKYKDYIGMISIGRLLGAGAFSDVYLCDYAGTCVYKEIFDKEQALFSKPKLERLVEFSNERDLIFPFRFIYEKPTDEAFKGYLMDYMYGYIGLDQLKNLDYDKKVALLKKARELILKLHKKYNCVHADTASWNFLADVHNMDVALIDFDLNISLKEKDVVDIDNYNIFASDYLDKVGIDEGLDIFLFNLTVFSILNGIDYYKTMDYIANKQFGVFAGDNNAIKILDSYDDLGCKKALKKEFINF